MKINVIGVPLYYGCDKQGVEIGPNELRKYGLIDIFNKKHEVSDIGNVSVDYVNEKDKFLSHTKMKYLSAVTKTNEELSDKVYESLCNSKFPLIVGGDHSLAIGSIAGSSKYFGQDYGVIWIDAHGDINTESTSPSGNIHGMPLAASMGIGSDILTNISFNGSKVAMQNIFILGARDLDIGELELIKEKNLNVWTMNDVKEKGLETCLNELIEKVNSLGINNLHLSFDIDSLDPSFTPGTGTPVVDGLTIDGGKKVLSDLIATNKVRCLDFVEFNPSLDTTDTTLNNCLSLLEQISNCL